MSSSLLHIVKMHGTGNDFVLVDNPPIDDETLPNLARTLCDRHFGIGADGLLVLSPTDIADVKMRIFNSDGSEAQMCGNGIRCVGKFLYDNNLTTSLTPTIDTAIGIKELKLHIGADGLVETVTVDMGKAEFIHPSVSINLVVDDNEFEVIPISVGNPHGIIVIDNPDCFPVEKIGPLLEIHEFWPEKANIEFVSVMDRGHVIQRTWERGVGETLACGTGACAVAFALSSKHLCDWPVNILLRGGELTINNVNDHLLMTGAAATVFNTTIPLPNH